MARSFKHSPGWGHTTARSEKKDKQLWHRCWRHQERQALQRQWRQGTEENHLPVHHRSVSDAYWMAKDGRRWRNNWMSWCSAVDHKARQAWVKKQWRK